MDFSLLHSAVTIMTPLLLAATGGLFTELAGMLNIALEGLLLSGAFAALVFTELSGSAVIGALAALLCSMGLAALLAFFVLRLKSNVFIAGLAVNLLSSGLSVVLSFRLFGTKGVVALPDFPSLKGINIPVIAGIPILGDLLTGHSWYVYMSWALLALACFVLFRTPFGFRLRGSGLNSAALASMGLNPDLYRFIAFLVSGFCCGMGGAFLCLNLGAFVPNISAGRGWIALALILLSRNRPLGLFCVVLIFGLSEAFSNYAQGVFKIPPDFILAFPYVLILLIMVLRGSFNRK
jgi:simple sugar transport system permease protein